MTLLASLVFWVLTPQTSQSMCQLIDNAYSVCRQNQDFYVFVEIIKTRERIRQHLIQVELRKREDAEWFQWLRESDRVTEESIRNRELKAKAKQNPGG